MTSIRFFTFFCALTLVAFAGCGDRDVREDDDLIEDDVVVEDDLVDGDNALTVAEDAGLTTFRTAVAQAGLDETLMGPGPYTIFAPSDEAFEALPAGTLESLMEEGDRDELANILRYHVVPRRAMSGDLSGTLTLNTVEGQPLTVTANAGTVTVTDATGNTATVVSADNEASNGVIHVIDRVLMPGDADMDVDMMEENS